MEDKLTGIIPFSYIGGFNKIAGSTFLRVDGLVSNCAGFEVWKHGKKYDSLIFQKAYWLEMMQSFEGPKILDLCDMDWINGSVDIIQIAGIADAITCSSAELTNLVKMYFPHKIVEHVPDRLNFEIFPAARPPHSDKAKNVTWFGFINNAYETLDQLYPVLKKCNVNLTIISNQPYMKEDRIKSLDPRFVRYEQQSAYHHIREADIVLNPRSTKANYKYKSNNKSLIAWKLGIPVAETCTDIERLMDPAERNRESLFKQPIVDEEYNILKSGSQYKKLINLIYF